MVVVVRGFTGRLVCSYFFVLVLFTYVFDTDVASLKPYTERGLANPEISSTRNLLPDINGGRISNYSPTAPTPQILPPVSG